MLGKISLSPKPAKTVTNASSKLCFAQGFTGCLNQFVFDLGCRAIFIKIELKADNNSSAYISSQCGRIDVAEGVEKVLPLNGVRPIV